ncbi:hypothetical protein ABZ815_11640 [Nonomuraea sp. NPDC047529]|uniref:hypothetical protein n=1 Tax=Nonomuraea sp. NPDC047529 TaxID=3155623 RepID=UPI003405140B
MNSRTARVLGLGAVMLAAAAAMTMPAEADDHGYLDESLEYVDVPYCAGYLELYDRDYCASPSRWTSSDQREDLSDAFEDESSDDRADVSEESEDASANEGADEGSDEGSDEGEDMSADEREDTSTDAPGDITFADGTVQDD